MRLDIIWGFKAFVYFLKMTKMSTLYIWYLSNWIQTYHNFFTSFGYFLAYFFNSSKNFGNKSCYLRQYSARLGTLDHFDILTNIISPWEPWFICIRKNVLYWHSLSKTSSYVYNYGRKKWYYMFIDYARIYLKNLYWIWIDLDKFLAF